MRSILIKLCQVLVCLSLFGGAMAAPGGPRGEVSLNAGWEFARGDALDPQLQPANAFKAAGPWRAVTLPHTFNAEDGTSPKFYRGAGWYRRSLTLEGSAPGRTWLEFDGAALVTDAWLNGVHLGRHEGGYARFRFEVTGKIQPGNNQLVVRVDNASNRAVAPLAGDYTVYGGLYREVRLVTTGDVHIDMMDAGGPGAYFHASAVSKDSARLHWTARLSNARSRPVTVAVIARLREPGGKVVATARQTAQLAPGSTTPVALETVLRKPHLWQGVLDPYLYTSEVRVEPAAGMPALLDQLAFQVGIRDIKIDAARGVLLNGQPHKVHGVNVHLTYVPGKGVAATQADIDNDYRILEELGVTGLRFAHYQHGQHSYELSNRKGYLVWTELPLTSEVDASEAFARNLAQQARELVRQNFNHPSVFVWGLGNEIYKVDDVSARILSSMQALVRAEDPSRPTAYANCCAPIDGPQASHTDLIGSNVYFGWYDKEFADLAPWMAENRKLKPTTPLSISEYGAGASVLHQEDPPQRPKPDGKWHPEQYQALYHEAAWRQIAATPWLWASYVWVGFDFPSAGRNEGDSTGVNDKGLISMDRKVRKDAYYWYQANWSGKPMVYISSRRHVERAVPEAEVKVYSNQPVVTLRVNGVSHGAQEVVGRIARWKIKLVPGNNRIEASSPGGTDSVQWRYQPPAM